MSKRSIKTWTFKYLPVKRLVFFNVILFKKKGEEGWFDAWYRMISKGDDHFIGDNIPFFHRFLKLYIRVRVGLVGRLFTSIPDYSKWTPNDFKTMYETS